MPKKILLIEDDEILRGIITQKFVKEGYKVVQAINGIDGLKAIDTERPDLVLLDILLPGMNGFEVLEKTKQNPSLAKIPIIILSNLSRKEDVEKGFKLGATDYLIKVNFTSQEVMKKIKDILQ